MEKKFCKSIFKGSLIAVAIALVGCGTPAAKNFGGSWKPVNHFQTHPTEIPLTVAYTFYAAPMDETLKTMLSRWAHDSGRKLSYQIPFDVTLYTPVSRIRTTDIDSAARKLTDIYAAQHLHVSATDQKILVLPSDVASRLPPSRRNVSATSTPAHSTGIR